MSSSNSIEELRKMAADKSIDSDVVLRQGFAIVADIGEDVGKIKEEQKKYQKEQGSFNSTIKAKVDSNSKTLTYYNNAVKTLGTGGVLWFIYEILARVF